MGDYDAIIIGAGPAGLTAGRDLALADYRVLVLDRESIGGRVMNVEWIEDYPNPGDRTAGSTLGSSLADQAAEAGVRLELGEVEEVEAYSSSTMVSRADGETDGCRVVVAAGGLKSKKLGVPGEERLAGKGVIHCAFCDAGLYAERPVVVCGAGDTGIIEAMYFAERGARVSVLEAMSEPSARPDLLARAEGFANLQIRLGEQAVEILGEDGVTGVLIEKAARGERESLDAYGVLVQVGLEPASECLEAVLALDEDGYAEIDEDQISEVPNIVLAGDMRRGSPRNVASAISDGARAAEAAMRILGGD